MIKCIISDFSRVLLFPKDKEYKGSLNALHKELSQNIDYDPLHYFDLNHKLLNRYSHIKTLPIYIFTSDSIQDSKEFSSFLKPIFKEILSAKKLNIEKKSPDAYTHIAKLLGYLSGEILYIDDSIENINAAKEAGCKTFLYIDNETLFSELNTIQ